jgi:hypothetical protein
MASRASVVWAGRAASADCARVKIEFSRASGLSLAVVSVGAGARGLTAEAGVRTGAGRGRATVGAGTVGAGTSAAVDGTTKTTCASRAGGARRGATGGGAGEGEGGGAGGRSASADTKPCAAERAADAAELVGGGLATAARVLGDVPQERVEVGRAEGERERNERGARAFAEPRADALSDAVHPGVEGLDREVQIHGGLGLGLFFDHAAEKHLAVER